MTKKWSDLERFPLNTQGWVAIHKTKGVLASGEDSVRRYMDNPLSNMNVLIGSPESERLLPVMCDPVLGPLAFSKLKKQVLFATCIVIVSLLAIVAMSLIHQIWDREQLTTISILVLTLIFLEIDRRYSRMDLESAKEKQLFFEYANSHNPATLVVFMVLMVTAGFVQLVYQLKIGSFEDLVLAYGLYFETAESGEIWRFFVGPFIHSGLTHWLFNFILLVLIGRLLGLFEPRWSISLFLIGTWFSGFCAFLSPWRLDALVGVSGGVYALFAGVAIAALKSREHYPRRFPEFMLTVGVTNIILGYLASPTTSNTAHIAGFLAGILFSLLVSPNHSRDQTKSRLTHHPQ